MMSRSRITKSANLPGVSEPMILFLEAGEGRPDRHRLERFLARHRLLGKPAARRPVVVVLARDGGVERVERIHALDREVAAVRDDDAGVEQRPPGVRAERARVAEPRRRPVHVARLMHGLHRRNDAELREARDVGVVEDLHVLDAKAMIDRRHGLERRFVRVERDAVAAIADRVRRDLEAVLERARGDVAEMRRAST